MDIKTVPQPPYSLDLATCDFWLLPKLRGCRYEAIEEMKGAMTKVIDTLTQEDFHGAFQKFLERYNKCIAAEGDYLKGDKSFVCVLSIKVPIRKKAGNLFKEHRIWFIDAVRLTDIYKNPFYLLFQKNTYLTVVFKIRAGWWGIVTVTIKYKST